MRKAIIVATLGSLVFAAPAAHANEWEGLAGGLAGGTHCRGDCCVAAATCRLRACAGRATSRRHA